MSDRRKRTRAFSLLEVILATAIVAASSMVILRLTSIGEVHFTRAERKSIASQIGQSVIDQMLLGQQPIESVSDQTIEGYSNWIFSSEVEPTDQPGLVRMRLRIAQKSPEEQLVTENQRYDFEVVRWLPAPRQSDELEPSRSEDLP